jgi:TetR/AcrR family transcriptional regulator, ethionamide resistance regulator
VSAEVELRVFEATERLLRDGAPFTHLALREISQAAGIARSTFYVHFADKSDLLLRLAARAGDDLRDAADGWWRRQRSGGQASLSEMMLQVIQTYRSHATVLAAVDEVAGYDPSVAALWRSRYDRYAQRLCRQLQDDQRAGWVPVDVDVPAAAFIVVWSIERAVSEHVRACDPAEDGALAEALTRFAQLVILGSRTAAA